MASFDRSGQSLSGTSQLSNPAQPTGCDGHNDADASLPVNSIAKIRTSTARQSAWNYLVFAISKSSTLLMTVVLARLLEPAEFGLFALALLLVNLFDYVKDLGVVAALVQSDRDWKRIAPTGFTLSIVFGVATGAALAATASISSAMLGHPELAGLIRVLAIALVISSLSAIPLARLRRDLSFHSRLFPEFCGAVAKTALTIGLAATGHGVWSLVYGQLAAVAITAALYWRAAPAMGRPGFDAAEARQLIRFGMPVTGVTLLAFAIYNVDYLAIGTRLGTTELGLYTLAYRIPELLVLNLCIVISEVLFSSLSRLQHDRAQLAAHYRQTLVVVMALTAPIGVGLAAVSGPLVSTLYGTEYEGAATMLAILAAYTVVYSASFHAGDVYKAVGRPGLLTAINAAKLLVLVGPVWWAAGHGATLVATAILGVETVHLALRLVLVRRLVPLRATDLLSAIARPVAAAVPMGLALVGLDAAMAGEPAPLRLGVLIALGPAIYLLALRFTAPQLTREALRLVKARTERLRHTQTAPQAGRQEPHSKG